MEWKLTAKQRTQVRNITDTNRNEYLAYFEIDYRFVMDDEMFLHHKRIGLKNEEKKSTSPDQQSFFRVI